MRFDPEQICAVLIEEEVQFVLVGGLAAVLHGSPLPTADVDVVPSRSDENLERLARALQRLGTKLRTEAEPVQVPLDAAFLKAMPSILNLVTDHGDLDVIFEPAGPRAAYAEWNDDAVSMTIGSGIVVRVADLQSVVDSKRAANRDKDIRSLPYLESLLAEIERRK